jgi:hypothetical protein
MIKTELCFVEQCECQNWYLDRDPLGSRLDAAAQRREQSTATSRRRNALHKILSTAFAGPADPEMQYIVVAV